MSVCDGAPALTPPLHQHLLLPLGAPLVNCAAAQFILRFRSAGSKGCAPTSPGDNILEDRRCLRC